MLVMIRCTSLGVTYYHIRNNKNDPRAGNGLFMGSSSGVGGYKLSCLPEKKMVTSRDVTFDEALMLKMSTGNNVNSFEDKKKEVSKVVQMELATSWKLEVIIPVVFCDSYSEDDEISVKEIRQ